MDHGAWQTVNLDKISGSVKTLSTSCFRCESHHEKATAPMMCGSRGVVEILHINSSQPGLQSVQKTRRRDQPHITCRNSSPPLACAQSRLLFRVGVHGRACRRIHAVVDRSEDATVDGISLHAVMLHATACSSVGLAERPGWTNGQGVALEGLGPIFPLPSTKCSYLSPSAGKGGVPARSLLSRTRLRSNL